MNETLLLFLLTFFCGAGFECGCVFWVHYAEKNKVGLAVLFSMFNALITIIGVEQFLKNRLFALAYVLGYGFGTYIAIKIKGRWLAERN